MKNTERPASASKSLPTLLTIEQVAEALGVSVRHVRRLVFEHRIPYLKWGHLLRFEPDDIRRWLDDAHIDTECPRSAHGSPCA